MNQATQTTGQAQTGRRSTSGHNDTRSNTIMEQANLPVLQLSAALLPQWHAHKMDIGRKETDPRTKEAKVVKIGTAIVPVPLLEAFGFTNVSAMKKGDDGKPLFDAEGLPIYENDAHDWAFGAIISQAKMQARNKLVPATVELKDGKHIACTMEELIAEGERVGNKEFMQLFKECRNAFTGYMNTLGKSNEAVAFAVTLFEKKDALQTQPETIKEKFKAYLEGFAVSLEAADAERYNKILARAEEAAATATGLGDF